jgi:accessory gene regulator protein AgrB
VLGGNFDSLVVGGVFVPRAGCAAGHGAAACDSSVSCTLFSFLPFVITLYLELQEIAFLFGFECSFVRKMSIFVHAVHYFISPS